MTDDYDPRVSIMGTGDPVVLVPGMDGTGLLFYRQIPLIARANRVASYALRDAATTMDVLIDDLRRVVDEVAAPDGRATIVGESFGGALAMSFALAEPGRVRRLVVVNAFPYFAPRIRLHAAILGLRSMPWSAMEIVRRTTAFRLHSRHTGRGEIDRFIELTKRTTKHGYINRLKVLTRYDIRERLHDLRPPTLFVAADNDRLVPAVDQARLMADRVPGSVIRILGGHGHVCLIAPDVDLGRILDEWSPA